MEYFDDYQVEVFVDDFDSLDKAIRRFTKKVKESDIFEVCSYGRVYEKPSDKKRRKKREMDYAFKKKSRDKNT
jgi:ribosomal protein S21